MKAQIKAWKRPSELQNAKPSLWGKYQRPMPHGTRQRSLGDCWFFVSMSSVAENPGRLTRVVWNNGYYKSGIFRFYFWVKGKWHPVNVDDRLPVRLWGRGWTT